MDSTITNTADFLNEEEDILPSITDDEITDTASIIELEQMFQPLEDEELDTATETPDSDFLSDEAIFPLPLVVYGNEAKLTMKQAQSAIQRGLAFDEIKTRLESAKNDERIKFVESMAKQNNMSSEEYMLYTKSNNVFAGLVKEYGSVEKIPPSVLENFKQLSQSQMQDTARYSQEKNIARLKEEYRDFIYKHPDAADISPQVIAMVKEGKPLETAYALHKSSVLEQQVQELKNIIKDMEHTHKTKTRQMSSSIENAGRDSYEEHLLQMFTPI